jgi:cytochrome c-type biogenesis protein CcmH/NrfF
MGKLNRRTKMADTPREKTRGNWIWLLAAAAVILAAVVWWSSTRRGEDIGGSLSMDESSGASAETAQGASEAVPAQTQNE